MKKSGLLALLMLCAISWASFGQDPDNRFKMIGKNAQSILINQTYTETLEIYPFGQNGDIIYGLDATADIKLNGENSLVRMLLTDDNFNEYLVYESYDLLLEGEGTFSIKEMCEETSILDGVKPYSILLEIKNAELKLKSLSFSTSLDSGLDVEQVKKQKKKDQNEIKIKKINNNLQRQGKHWVAGPTSVSELSYGQRKKLYGQSTFPAGFEYYAGGVITAGSTDTSSTDGTLKSVTTTSSSPYVDEWDWRNRHEKNWITSVKNQGLCGGCWAFATAGATEAMVNLAFNQQLNLDLSEQDLISCSPAGGCGGGVPGIALDYISTSGIVDETTFPYSETDQTCNNKGTNPGELIKIGGKYEFGSSDYPRTEDILKKMLIHLGPVSGGLHDWNHAMTLVGYKVVKEGDVFYYRDLNLWRSWKTVEAGDPLIGKTVWIFKNSWGEYSGDEGYVYVETPLSNIVQTFAIKTPISSEVKNRQVVCEDRDGDGYYWWGLGPKPATCNGPDQPDGNDADPTLGPIDQYGYCMKIGVAPVANFNSTNTTVTNDETVTFSDLSSNALTRQWIFEGGIPSSSTLENPVVSFPNIGTYDVSLTVTNPDGSDSKTISNYITVQKKSYCNSYGDASNEWIASVKINDQTHTSESSGTTGYKNVTDFTFNATAGSSQDFTLTPGFTGTSQYEFWRIWIDFNDDGDFDDDGEQLVWTLYGKSSVSGTFEIPAELNITTRMRISMHRNSTISQCDVFDYGEVEDFTIQIGSGSSIDNSPVANFTSSKTSINTDETLTFTDLSTNTPTSWSWSFEGGSPATSTTQNPAVTYSSAGTYKVTLTATNADGSDTKSVDNYITVTQPVIAPVADFSASPRSLEKGGNVNFSDLSSNSPTSWSWTFEEGTPATSTAKNPTVTYNTSGSYKVVLTATNAGGSNTKTAYNFIEVTESVVFPVADFAANKTIINTGESVSFSDISSDATSRSWIFEGGNPGTSTAQNPIVTYYTAGTYKVTITATNGSESDTKIIDNYITVTEPVNPAVPPVADFSANKTAINTGESVNFSDLSSDATSWSWTFEGGTPGTSTAQNPTISYNTAGTYNVTLKAINADGSDTQTVTNYIQVSDPVIPPTADFTADNTSITEGETVTFSDQSNNEPTSWSWTFEGGTPGTSNQQNPMVTYATAGTYSVTMLVSNPAGSDTKTALSYIQVKEYVHSYCIPTASASSEWIAGVKIGEQSKTSGSNGYADFTSFGFDLESGTNQTITLTPGFNPRSKFEYWAVWIDLNQDMIFSDSEKLLSSSKSKSEISGTIIIPTGYNITTRMRVAMSPTAPAACSDLTGEVEDYTVNIYEPAPVADFTVSSTTVAVGESVQFTNTSLYNPTSLSWDFGITNFAAGSESAEEPVITYNSPGEYLVTLTASNNLGSSQKSKTITVHDQSNPVLDYCIPVNISTTANYISSVVFTDIEVQSGGDGYLLSATSFTNIVPGQSYFTELTPLTSSTRNFWRIWIDFNMDGDFEDADETVFLLNNKKGTVSDDIFIPTYASGTTRMRVAMKVGGAPAACEDGFAGEVEDYTISFTAPMMASTSKPLEESVVENNIEVYPNPTTNYININVHEIGFEDTYSIYDLSGKIVTKGQISSSFTKVDLSDFPSGIYLVKVLNFDKMSINKIIKKD